MRNRKTQGFTLIELLIVIAIIGILAAVLIPNLLNARRRAFDTATQTCLKEIGTHEELAASTDPWEYTNAASIATGINSCEGVTVAVLAGAATDGSEYGYSGIHANGTAAPGGMFYIRNGAGVTNTAPTF